jgi:hypothetical protein
LHPNQICEDISKMGSRLVLEGEDLYIENPENIYPEIEEAIKSYKKRIIQHLTGKYTSKDHNVKQTIDKIVDFYLGIDQEINPRINDWLNNDEQSLYKVMKLFVLLSYNGWTIKEPIANYEDEDTERLSLEIFEEAMSYFKGK